MTRKRGKKKIKKKNKQKKKQTNKQMTRNAKMTFDARTRIEKEHSHGSTRLLAKFAWL